MEGSCPPGGGTDPDAVKVGLAIVKGLRSDCVPVYIAGWWGNSFELLHCQYLDRLNFEDWFVLNEHAKGCFAGLRSENNPNRLLRAEWSRHRPWQWEVDPQPFEARVCETCGSIHGRLGYCVDSMAEAVVDVSVRV